MKGRKLKFNLVLAFVIVLAVFFGFETKSSAAEYTDSNNRIWTFNVSGSEATITKVSGTLGGTLNIPSTVTSDGTEYTVTELQGSYWVPLCNNTSVTQVVIPNTVKVIGNYSFYNMKITSINFPDSVTTIKSNAVRYCSNLQSITMTNSVISIENNAFDSSYSKLTSMVISSNITSDYVISILSNAYNLTDVSFAATGSNGLIFENGILYDTAKTTVYKGIGGITSAVLPNTVTEIKNQAFYNCSKLTTVVMSENVNSVGNNGSNLFSSNNKITSITISAKLSISVIKNMLSYSSNINSISLVGESEDYVMTADGSIYNKDYTTLYLCANKSLTNYTFIDTVTSIDANAFKNCSKLESVTMTSAITSVGNTIFSGAYNIKNLVMSGKISLDNMNTIIKSLSNLEQCTLTEGEENNGKVIDGVLYDNNVEKLYSCIRGLVTDELILPDTVKRIESEAFQYVKNVKKVTMNQGLEYIGGRAFYECKMEGPLNLPDTLTRIENDAFYNCSNLKGDIIIPDLVTYLGSSAFYGCESIDGEIRVGDSVPRINWNTFYKITKETKVTIGAKVTNIDNYNFKDLTDIWVRNTKGNIQFSEYYCEGDLPYIHFLNDTHYVTIGTVPGLRIVNIATGNEVTSGEFECETAFRYRIEALPGYNFSELKLVEVNDNNLKNYTSKTVHVGEEYDFTRLLRDRRILIQPMADGTDLALRTFITEVNRTSVSRPRIPNVLYTSNGIEYQHTKYPLKVKTGDIITYKIRVYNEGLERANCKEVSVHIPNGMEVVSENVTNTKYGWTVTNGVAKSTYLNSKYIDQNYGTGILSYKDLEIVLKVNEESSEKDVLKTVFAEISGLDVRDADSTPGNVVVSENYKKDEIYNSNTRSYIKGQEDDDDFDTVILNAKIKVEYNLKLRKIDSKTKEYLKGAQFDLKSSGENILGFRRTDANGNEYTELRQFNDGEVIATAVSDENGIVDFGGIMTFDSGEDIFFVEETRAPAGYLANIGNQMRVKVVKTIVDEDKGTYSVKVFCESNDVSIDSENFEFTPIATADQLKKIGSGEIVNVNGTDYEFNIDTNYKLLNDIDLAGINWTPINNEMKCVIDGNGHKIKNLTITNAGEMGVSEVGLISVFSGIVQNLTFENPNISISTFAENAENTSEYTGVGCFAGVMTQGYIRNCKITKTEGNTASIEASVNNIGGFVGHTTPGGIVEISNSSNAADIKGNTYVNSKGETVGVNNVGGFIGTCLSSVSIENSTNTGKIETTNYNAGGLVGFVNPSDYSEIEVVVGYDENNKTIDLVVENTKSEGSYYLKLEIRDQKTSALIGGATYEIDKVDDVVRTALLDTGSLKIFDKIIKHTGRDTFFLTEDEVSEGYTKLDGIIRVEIDRYWDFDTNEFKVRANAELVGKKEYEGYDGDRETNDPVNNGEVFDKGSIFTDVNIANAEWNLSKAEFKNCSNSGEIKADKMNAAGILGTSYGRMDIKDCTNNGYVSSGGKAGGIIAELRTVDGNDFDTIAGQMKQNKTHNTYDTSEFSNCTNNGKVEVFTDPIMSYNGIVGGIIAETRGYIKINKCTNNGEVKGSGYIKAGGITGSSLGAITINECKNNEKVSSELYSGGYGYSNISAGGILGFFAADSVHNEKIDYNKAKVRILNCENYANVTSSGRCSGILGQAYCGQEVTIQDCIVKGKDENNKITLLILPGGEGELGGVLGASCCEYTNITGNIVEYVDALSTTYKFGGCSSNAAGGMLGGVYNGSYYSVSSFVKNYNSSTQYTKGVSVRGNMIRNSRVECHGKEVGGIWGTAVYCDKVEINISDCEVDNCYITEINPAGSGNSSYNFVGGIFAGGYQFGPLNINYCTVKNSDLRKTGPDDSYCNGQSSIGGIFGRVHDAKSYININDCDVLDCDIYDKAVESTCGNTGGIVGNIDEVDGNVTIARCNLERSRVAVYCGQVGGILGMLRDLDYGEILIEDCNCLKVNLAREADYPSSTTYGKIGGIMAYIFDCDGDLIIRNCNIIGKETDDPTQRNYISSMYGGVAGAVGGTHFSGSYSNNYKAALKINDLVIQNMDILMTGGQEILGVSYAEVGGVLANGMSNCEFEDILVDNCNIKANKGRNIGGILGWTNNEFKATNCDVTNCNIENKAQLEEVDRCGWGTYGNIGGLAASNGNKSKYVDCDVKNCTISGGAIGASGGVYWANSEFKAENCTVDNVTITDNWVNPDGENSQVSSYQHYRTFSGFISNCSNDTYLKNINVSNFTCKPAKYGHIGGIFSWLGNVKELTNCTVENADMESIRCIDGTNGAIGGLGADLSKLTGLCYGNKVKDTNIAIGSHLAGGMFGYVGYTDNSVQEISDCEIDNVNITHKNVSYNNLNSWGDSCAPSVGGFIGENSRGALVLKDSTIKNSTIEGQNPENIQIQVGGVVGVDSSGMTIDNVKVVGTKVNNLSNACTGGFVGWINSGTTIKNSSLEQSSEVKGVNQVGGFVGNGKVIANDNKILNSNVILNNNGYGHVGGFISISEPGSSIDGLTIDNVNVTDSNTAITSSYDHAGGVAAVYKGSISNVNASNINVTGSGNVGGIAGLIEDGTTSNVTINGGNLTSRNGHAGGLYGVTYKAINSANVSNLIITGKDCTGGIVGIFSDGVSGETKTETAQTISVTDCSITSENAHAGGITAVSYGPIVNGTVTGSTVTAKLMAGGIVGTTNKVITGCDVSSTSVTSQTSHAGGLVACTTSPILNSSVVESTITILTDQIGSSMNCVGGLVAAGAGTNPIMSGVTVRDNNIVGGTQYNRGKYIGAPTVINNNLLNAEAQSSTLETPETEVPKENTDSQESVVDNKENEVKDNENKVESTNTSSDNSNKVDNTVVTNTTENKDNENVQTDDTKSEESEDKADETDKKGEVEESEKQPESNTTAPEETKGEEEKPESNPEESKVSNEVTE